MKVSNYPNNTKTSLEVILHILVWIVIFVMPQVLLFRSYDPENKYRAVALLGAPVCLALVFYLNYLWLIPRYLFNHGHKNVRKFIILNLTVYLIAMVTLNVWHEFTHRQDTNSKPQSTELPTPPPNHLNAPPPPPSELSQGGKPHTVHFDRKRNPLVQQILFETRDLLLMALVTVLALLIQRSKKFQNAEQARKQAELKQTEAEVKSLVNQMSPHFLLNTLNNIYALVAINPQQAQESIDNLSKLLRHMLYENRKEHTTLGKDVEFVVKYIELMKLRLSSNVDVQYDVNIDGVQNMPVKPLILIPLIENAFKHGVSNTEPSFIHMTIDATPQQVHYRIENSNHPKQQNDHSGSGIGLEVVEKRLQLTYPGKYTWTHGTNKTKKTYISDLTVIKQ